MEPKFTISAVTGAAWRALKSQVWILAGLLIGYTIISFTLSAFGMPAQGSAVGRAVVSLVGLLFGGIFSVGYMKNVFQALDGEEPQFSAYGQGRAMFVYIAASVLMTVVVAVGLCLFVLPGIYLGIRLQYFAALVVEERAGVLESLKGSWQLTRGQVVPLVWLFLAEVGILLAGVALFFVGVFVAAPLAWLMYAESYRKLSR